VPSGKYHVEKLSDALTGEDARGGAEPGAERPARSASTEERLEADLQELQLARPPPGGWPEEGLRSPYVFQSGASYSGQWRRNHRHGVGRQEWPDGASYAGEWSEGTASGRGCFTFPEGGTYVGEWQQNRFHGCGTYYDPNRTVFRGEWREGLREGCGVEDAAKAGAAAAASTSSSTRYAGAFRRGVKDGPGICTWTDGGEYCGQWRRDNISGAGAYSCKERGRTYRGQWLDSMKHGAGTYDWPDGRSYRGQYWQDQASGFGVFAWADGQQYEGYWLFGKQHGAGLYTDTKGSADLLSWSNGQPCKVHHLATI